METRAIRPGMVRIERIGPITRQDISRYAGASGDFNPIHIDEEFARKAGFKSVFAMGMLTSAHLSRLISDWVGPNNVKRFKTRFTGKVWPGDELELKCLVKEKNSDGTYELDVSASNQGNEIVISGNATVIAP
ncbi:MAG: hypothetical protein GXP49_04655 [Deltaproteobacteria bacterium]|nr:hypothetical protein [Deltaproteobacteria bacterium]